MVGVRMKYGRWEARCCISGKEVYVGTFDTEEEAISKRNEYIKNNKPPKTYKPSYDKSKNRWIVRLKCQRIPANMRNKNFKTQEDAEAHCAELSAQFQ